MTQGVYLITNARNGKTYVGSSTNIERRWDEHRSLLRTGKHFNRYLSAAVAKHGLDAFTIATLEVVADRTTLVEREAAHMLTVRPAYNLAQPTPYRIGHHQTPETRAKIAATKTGKALSPAHRATMSAVRKGNPPHPALTAAQKKAVTGKPRSPEVRAKIAAGHTNGGTHCNRGHPFDAANTRHRKNGTRQCRACDALRAREVRAGKR